MTDPNGRHPSSTGIILTIFLGAVLLVVATSATLITATTENAATELDFASNVCEGLRVDPEGTLTASWLTTQPTDVNHLLYGIDDQYGSIATASSGRSHVVSVERVPDNATLHARAYSEHTELGAIVQSGDCIVSVSGIDRTAPVVRSLRVTERTSTTAVLTVETNEPTIAWVTVIAGPELIAEQSSTTHATHHTFTISSLNATTRYVARFDIVDAAGNSVPTKPGVEFSTRREGTEDAEPPAITAFSCIERDRALHVTFSVDDPTAIGRIAYGTDELTNDVEAIRRPSTNARSLFAHIITPLPADTSYRARAMAVDLAGNPSWTEIRSCTKG